ncbi:MAG: DUF932 domain-containing protein [Deltaproteobacteria bacterium]|nr:DUF932 domain-containing protein [Deltaproteobacteria bacterium]
MRQLTAQSHAISNDGLRRIAPSIFADHADFEVSDRYSFVPTIELVDMFRDNNWFPSYVSQTAGKTPGGLAVAKHQIRFRQAGSGDTARLNDSVMELVLTNSHNRSSGFLLDAGLFRKVCDNGLIVKDSNFGGISIRHTGNAPEIALEAAVKMVDEIPLLQKTIDQWQCIDLDATTQLQIARRGAELRWGDASPVSDKTLLRAHRYADDKGDLWSTFNRVQENLIRGGNRGRGSTGRRLTTREIGSIDVGRKINRGLWEHAAGIAEAA